jgi:redox-sensing transcriptional repressor
MKLPGPTHSRLLRVLRILEQDHSAQNRFTSAELGERIGFPAHTIRKDFCYLGGIASGSGGYDVEKLKSAIRSILPPGLINCCVIGLNSLGVSILQNDVLPDSGINLLAGFDDNINRIETIHSKIPLYPLYELPEQVQILQLGQAILTVENQWIDTALQKIQNAGIKGVLNLTARILPENSHGMIIKNFDLTGELLALHSAIRQHEIKKPRQTKS